MFYTNLQPIRSKKLVLLYYCIVFITLPAYSQNTSWMHPAHQSIFNKMGLEYHNSPQFTEKSKTECFRATPFLEDLMTCLGEQLHSSDEHFIVFLAIFPIRTREDSAQMATLFPNLPQTTPDCQHICTIKYHLKLALNRDVSGTWKKYVDYYPESITKKKFNADTVITYPIQLPDSKAYYQGKYNHLKVILLQKNGRGNVPIYCLYDDKGKKKLKKYLKAIENSFRYADEIDK